MSQPLIVFDIDGTLTDSATAHQQCFTKALEHLGLRKSEDYGDYKHHTDHYIFRAIFHDNNNRYPDDAEQLEFFNLLSTLFETCNIHPIDGAVEFIKQLLVEKIPHVYATGSIEKPAIKKLASIDVINPTPRLATSDNIDSREEIVNQAIEKAKLFYNQESFSKIVSVGDGIWDYKTAQNLNLSFIGIGNNKALNNLMQSNSDAMWPILLNKNIEEMIEQSITFK